MSEKTDKVTRVFEFHCSDEDGLLGQLRPYRGFEHAVLDELKEALELMVSLAEAGQSIGFRQVDLVYTVVWTVRGWSVADSSMLVRNGLVEPADQKSLADWVQWMEREFLRLLGALADLEQKAAGNAE